LSVHSQHIYIRFCLVGSSLLHNTVPISSPVSLDRQSFKVHSIGLSLRLQYIYVNFSFVGSSPLHIPCFEFRFVELSAFPYIKFRFVGSSLDHNTPYTSIRRSFEIPDICHSTKPPFTFTFNPEDLTQRVEVLSNPFHQLWSALTSVPSKCSKYCAKAHS
jgi:hypothetical protein